MKKPSTLVAAAVAMAIGLLATRAIAACGDDIDGERVPCRCGDIVVADTRLQADDPVIAESCMIDGLFVRAPHGAETIRLDLAGLTMSGTSHGTGIHVLNGGREGAVITGGSGPGQAQVTGFRSGFRAAGQRSVKELSNINFVGNVSSGVTLRGAGTVVRRVTAENNGRDGLRIGGRATQLEEVEASKNGRYGVLLTTPGAEQSNTVAVENERGNQRISGQARRSEGDR